MADQPSAIFVYGSLRPGGSNFHWIAAHVIDVEPAIFEGHVLYGLGLPFPYAAPGHGRVIGDLLHIADGKVEEVLAALDQLEGYEGEDAALTYTFESSLNPLLWVPDAVAGIVAASFADGVDRYLDRLGEHCPTIFDVAP